MAISKYAAIRHRIIDQRIGNKYRPFPSKEELRAACEIALFGDDEGNNVSISSIDKDLKYMKLEYDAPIKYSRANGGLYYAEEGFSLDLNVDQIEAVKLAANVLSQFKNTEIFSEFHSAIDKILDRVNISANIQDVAIQDYVQFETAPSTVGAEYLGVILDAIKNKITLAIDYQKFQSTESKTRSLNPYLLKEYRNRWYVVGFDNKDEFVKTYSLDRIKKVEITPHNFEVIQAFNVKHFFKHNLGITSASGAPEKVILSLTPLEGMYAKSQPFHWTQKIVKDNEKECVVELEVFITKELKMNLLSIGNGVRVLSPKSLIKELKQTYKKALDIYENE